MFVSVEPDNDMRSRGEETLAYIFGESENDYGIEFKNRWPDVSTRAIQVLDFLRKTPWEERPVFECGQSVVDIPRGMEICMWTPRALADACGMTYRQAYYHISRDPDLSGAWRGLRDILAGFIRDGLLNAALGVETPLWQINAAARYLGFYDREAKVRNEMAGEGGGPLRIEQAVVNFPQDPRTMGPKNDD